MPDAEACVASWLEVEAFEGLDQRFVVGFEQQTFAPDGAGFTGLAKGPEHFAQMGGYLCIGFGFVGRLQDAQGLLVLALAAPAVAEPVPEPPPVVAAKPMTLEEIAESEFQARMKALKTNMTVTDGILTQLQKTPPRV